MTAELGDLTTAQVGDFGEEIVLSHLRRSGATVVAADDSELPRSGTERDIDIVAVIDGEFVAVEVKTRYRSRHAGWRTRSGNLPAPRLGRGRRRADGTRSPAQGADVYVLERVAQFLDFVEGDSVVELRVVAVDLRSGELQWFGVEDGRVSGPLSAVVDCRGDLRVARTVLCAAGRWVPR